MQVRLPGQGSSAIDPALFRLPFAQLAEGVLLAGDAALPDADKVREYVVI